MTYRTVVLVLGLPLLAKPGWCEVPGLTLPAGTPMVVLLEDHAPLKIGQRLRTELVYSVYSGNEKMIPGRAVVEGRIVGLKNDKQRRIHAGLHGDLTPFHKPVVQFTGVVLTDGSVAPLTAGEIADGATYLTIVPPPHRTGSLIHQGIAEGKRRMHEQMSQVTDPDKLDRILQYLYSQLPYHPQRIEKGTAWTFKTSAPFTLPPHASVLQVEEPKRDKEVEATPKPAEVVKDTPPTWKIEAMLNEALTSATAYAGQPIRATVAVPIFNVDKTVAVPAGSTLSGSVTEAKPARLFGRKGTLRFAFNQLNLPQKPPANVQATLTGVATESNETLTLDSEGQIKPKSPNRFIQPLLLAFLATRPLDTDGRNGRDGRLGKDAVGSNGFGLIGRVLGMAGQSPNLAAGIGYYGTAVSFYERWIARGKETELQRDTRVTLETSVRRSEPLKPVAAR